MNRKRLPVLFWYAVAIGVAVATMAQTPTPSPTPNVHPGTWQVQPGIFVPCNGIKPFQPFVNVGDGNSYYLGGDVNANIAHPNLYKTYIDAIYYNHTRAYYSAEGFITPMFPQLGPGNFYPAPSTAAGLCTQFASFTGNTATCPTATDALYTSKFLLNDVWLNSKKVYQDSINIACNGIQPTAPPTLTPTPARTPTPTVTPSGPDPFAAYDEALYNLKISAGCNASPLMFCPNNPLTREQFAAQVWNVLHLVAPETYPTTPPPCVGIYQDVRCK